MTETYALLFSSDIMLTDKVYGAREVVQQLVHSRVHSLPHLIPGTARGPLSTAGNNPRKQSQD